METKTLNVRNIKQLTILIICICSFQCAAQTKKIDTLSLPFTFQGNVLDTFDLDANEMVDDLILSLHVQENYLECILENNSDTTYSLLHSCGQLKTVIQIKDPESTEYPGGCDYDGNNFRALYPYSGFNIYIPKNPLWKNLELRAGIIINGRKIYSNWVRYE